MKRGLECFERALVIAPHTDDEFGCAGTIVKLVEAGVEVRYLALSRCEESVPAGLPPDTLARECLECTRRMGIPETHVTIGAYQVRHFPRDRQLILEHFVAINREYVPDLVLLPSSSDIHQDHRTAYEEGFRAFKHSSLLGYELPQNINSFSNSAFVGLGAHHLDRKIEALSAYRSQGFRPYSTEEFIRGLAKVRGVQAKEEYAEAFELIRMVFR